MHRKSGRVLLADHDPASRRTLERRLVEAGHRVATAASGADVLLQADIDPPQVLIMEVELPDMDGFEVCETLHRTSPEADVTVILISRAPDEMTRAYLGQMVDYAGGDYFFATPFDHRLLLKLLDDMVSDVARTGTPRKRAPSPQAVLTTARLSPVPN